MMRTTRHLQPIICGIIFCLLSCNDKLETIVPSIESIQTESTDDNNTTKYNTQYLNLLDIVEQMRVYTEEQVNRPLVIFEGDTEECISTKRQQRENKLHLVEILYDLVQDLITGKKKTLIVISITYLWRELYI